jgi:hypothetical protein
LINFLDSFFVINAKEIRAKTLEIFERASHPQSPYEYLNIKIPSDLPLININLSLRPAEEIVQRAMGIHAVEYWCTTLEDYIPNEIIRNHLNHYLLEEQLTNIEVEFLYTKRSDTKAYSKQAKRIADQKCLLA